MDHEPDRAASDEEPDQRTDDQSAPSLGRRRLSAAGAGGVPAREPHRATRGMGSAHQRGGAAGRDVGRGDLLRGDRGVRQLRGCPRDRQHREPADVRPRALGADHPPRRRDPRGARDRAPPARRTGAIPVRQVPEGPGAPESDPRLVRAGGEPDRGDGGRELRRGARARHQRTAGGACGSCPRRSCSCATAC